MLTPTDIAEYGERHVEDWLKANNFHCHRSTHTSQPHGHHSHAAQHNAIDLEARNPELNMMVHVRTALAPHKTHELTDSERHSISSRALMLEYEAWFAQVQINASGDLVNDIQWTKLV
jgi:hypothetical protein